MKITSISNLRKTISDIINRISYRNERVIIYRREKPIAAIISLDDLKKLEEKD